MQEIKLVVTGTNPLFYIREHTSNAPQIGVVHVEMVM
jgi:hypothetical protein